MIYRSSTILLVLGFVFCVATCAFAHKHHGISEVQARSGIVAAANVLYDQRAHETYTEDMTKRWVGIRDRVRPPSAPAYSDCSSAATWAYWTVYGGGADFLNGQNWEGGNTSSMLEHGRKVSLSDAQPGDLIFYGNPVDHVAIYMGNNKVVTHGEDPVCYCELNYRGDFNQARAYL